MSNGTGGKTIWDEVYSTIEGMHEYDGLMCLPCMPKHVMNELKDFEFQADDILIVSYPQSGFFWMQEVLYHLHNQNQLDVDAKDKDTLAMRVPFLEHEFRNKKPSVILNSYPKPRLLKTHLPYSFLKKQLEPLKDKVKVILWTLEPKGSIGNYHNFWNTKCKFFDFPEIAWEKFFQLFQKKQLFEGDWYDTNTSWVDVMGGQDNFLWLPYEQAKKDVSATTRLMADFCGIRLSTFKLEKLAYVVDYDPVVPSKERFTIEQAEIVDQMTKEKLDKSPLAKGYCTTALVG